MRRGLGGYMMNEYKCLYNNTYETAIRILTLIDKFDRELELQELIYFDYLLIHISELEEGLESLHPANPYHITEAYSRRNLIQQSLLLLVRKHLIEISYDSDGMKYKKCSITREFLNNFSSDYYRQIDKNSIIILKKFEHSNLNELELFMKNILNNATDIYANEILLRGGYFDL